MEKIIIIGGQNKNEKKTKLPLYLVFPYLDGVAKLDVLFLLAIIFFIAELLFQALIQYNKQ